MLLAGGANLNAVTKETMKVTPLASAAAARQIGIARVLIAHGANVNAQAENDFTPLHEAAANGDLELAPLLLEHGAKIDSKTRDGKTALAFALNVVVPKWPSSCASAVPSGRPARQHQHQHRNILATQVSSGYLQILTALSGSKGLS